MLPKLSRPRGLQDPARRGLRDARSSCSPRAARRSTRWWAWSWAPTTTSPSPSRSASCWRACAPSCAAPRARKKRLSRYRFADVELDFETYRAKKGGEPLDLSPREFELLRYLIERKGETVSRDQLLEDVWGYESYPSTRTVDTHIAKLRAKIGDSGSEPRYILTIHGVGLQVRRSDVRPMPRVRPERPRRGARATAAVLGGGER